MKKLAIMVAFALALCTIAPVQAKMLSHTGNVKECATKAYKYTQLVKYKDADIREIDVIQIIAPRLQLPDDWEQTIERIVNEIYTQDLTEPEVFDRIYIRCIHGYSV